jgi:glycolate oxidase
MIEHFKKIVGEKNCSILDLDLLAYASDASQIEGKATLVVWPETLEQVHEIILFANRSGIKIYPRGAGSGLAGAAVPQTGVVIDFSRMNAINNLNVKEMTVEVEPGVVLDDLNYRLQKNNLYFPVIPSSHTIATIGGMIATNAAGNRAIKYGSMDAWIKELEVIDGTGKYYHVTQHISDFVGKEGLTGIIVKAVLKLAKPLETTSMSIFSYSAEAELIAKIADLRKNEHLIGLEFVNKTTAKLMGKEELYILFAEFESNEGQIHHPDEITAVWNTRENAYPTLAALGNGIIEDPQLADKIDEFLAWLESNKIPAFGHIGVGIIHPVFQDTKLIPQMHELVKKLGGKVTGEHGYGIQKKEFIAEDVKEKLIELKKKFDPSGILRGKI